MKNTQIIMKTPSLIIAQEGKYRICRSKFYSYNMNMETGEFARWGITPEHDPKAAPFPEILDLEVTEICNGPNNKPCSFCYHSNVGHRGRNMTLNQFKNIIDKMPFLTQCALGADAHGTTNPDMFAMMDYARSKGIIPNLTIAQISDEVADKLVSVAGAVAVSVYKHAGVDIAYDSIKKLTDASSKTVRVVVGRKKL